MVAPTAFEKGARLAFCLATSACLWLLPLPGTIAAFKNCVLLCSNYALRTDGCALR